VQHASSLPAHPPTIGKTDDMDLDRNPFMGTALDDEQTNRTLVVTAGSLEAATGQTPATGHTLDRTEIHHVTETFTRLWSNIPATQYALILSVMHGINKEPRHPAMRVTPTKTAHLMQAQVGDSVTLVYRADPAAPHRPLTWLAILHAH
jgi:hypothetical protein